MTRALDEQLDPLAAQTGPEQPATHVRYRVVGMAVLLAMVTYLDRMCISTVKPQITGDLGLSDTQMSYVFSAFALAYAAFEIPTASWADREGTRSVLTRIVLWWSSFTVATAAAFNYASLLAIRFLFGMGEAGAWPSVARTFSRWIPKRERGTVQGIFFVGAHLAGGVTPLLVMMLLWVVSWRTIFVMFGMVGFAWAATWYLWFRNDPEDHPAVSPAELRLIHTGRAAEGGHSAGWQHWRRLLSHRNTRALCLMYFPNSFAFYFCMTWLPSYLGEELGYTDWTLAILAGLPFFLSVPGDLCGGLATDWIAARFGLRIGRCGVGGVSYLAAGAAMIVAGASPNPMLSAVAIAVATAATMLTLGAAWGTCLDIGGSHTGVVSAAMNTSGQVGAILSPLVAVRLKEWFGTWSAPLYLMGGLFLVGAVFWLLMDPRERVFD